MSARGFGLVAAGLALATAACGVSESWTDSEVFVTTRAGDEVRLVGLDLAKHAVHDLTEVDVSTSGGNASSSTSLWRGSTPFVLVATGGGNESRLFQVDTDSGRLVPRGVVAGAQVPQFVGDTLVVGDVQAGSTTFRWYDVVGSGEGIGSPRSTVTVPYVVAATTVDGEAVVAVGSRGGRGVMTRVADGPKPVEQELALSTVTDVACADRCVAAGAHRGHPALVDGSGTVLPVPSGPVAGMAFDGSTLVYATAAGVQPARVQRLEPGARAATVSADLPFSQPVGVAVFGGATLVLGETEAAVVAKDAREAEVLSFPGASTTEGMRSKP